MPARSAIVGVLTMLLAAPAGMAQAPAAPSSATALLDRAEHCRGTRAAARTPYAPRPSPPDDTITKIAARADEVLYRAKERGRNRIELAVA